MIRNKRTCGSHLLNLACLAGSMLLVFCVLSGCARKTFPVTRVTIPMPRAPLEIDSIREILGSYREGNFENRSWPDAFQAMHQKLSREYPFTEWKEIDWDVLYDAYYPLVEAAEAEQDEQAWYRVLREYLHSIPDGYLRITTPDEYREAAIGGGYGFSVLPLDDGRIVVVRIEPDSFAALAGIQWGAEIIEWDGVPVWEALGKVPLLWSDTPSATKEYRIFEQCALLTRAPVGTETAIMFRNPNSDSIWITRLEARRDQYQTLADLTGHGRDFSEFDSPLDVKILDDNVGYIKIYCHASTFAMPFPARAFRRAIERFIQAGVNGIVLDLRGNTGGQDDLAVTYAGHFTDTPLFFRDVVAFDYAKGGFAHKEDARLVIEPRTPYFGGPVMVLLHRTTRDGGQALAASLQELPNVTTLGVTGTEGSWAYLGSQITMPQGYAIIYPIGRMLDEAGGIRISAQAGMESRLDPEIRIPLTMENCSAFFEEKQDVVLTRALEEIKAQTN